ncbi:MAG: NUDIX domain-containing protein [Sphaerimonospora mesophila]
MSQTEPPINLRVAAKAVIVQDGKVLLLREASTYEEGTNLGKWGVPGGRIEASESFFDGLRREVDEETGLEIEAGMPIHIGEWWPMIHDVKNHIVALFVRCTPLTNDVRLSDEHDAFAWVGLDELADYNVMPPDDEVIQKALAK